MSRIIRNRSSRSPPLRNRDWRPLLAGTTEAGPPPLLRHTGRGAEGLIPRRSIMESAPYEHQDLRDAAVVEVRPDPRRRFLVVSGTLSDTGKPWALVLEREN